MAKIAPVRVITVTSGKGGVGKTNVSVNLATALSSLGRKVMLMDADLGLANVDVMLGLQPKYNLSHVISGERRLDEIIEQAPGDIALIPAASGIQKMVELSAAEHAGLIRAFSELESELDVLIIDTAAGIADSVISFCRASQEVVVVVCDEPTSITDAYALIKVLNRDHAICRFRILCNMAHTPKEGRELFAKLVKVTDKFLDEVVLDFMGAIPYDQNLRKAVKRQRAVVDLYPSSPASLAFREAAKTAERWPMPSTADGNLEFFVERLVGSSDRAMGGLL
ncbi:MAG: MinD/ParA family protein [Chromatiales bacterium]|nr:MinD/ParA family protein [Chromatiales bacterium]